MSASPSIRGFSMLFGGLFGLGASVLTPKSWVPAETRERWETEAKYDYWQTLRNEAGLSNKRTMLSTKRASDIKSTSYRLPRVEREFFEAFVNAPKSSRSDILDIAPPYMQDYLRHFWRLKDEAIEAKLEGVELSQSAYNIDMSAYEEYVERNIPQPPEIVTTNPLLDLNKLKTLEVIKNIDYSKYSVYADDITAARSSLIDFEALFGERWNQYNQTIMLYNGISKMAQLNGGIMNRFSIAPQYDGANITVLNY